MVVSIGRYGTCPTLKQFFTIVDMVPTGMPCRSMATTGGLERGRGGSPMAIGTGKGGGLDMLPRICSNLVSLAGAEKGIGRGKGFVGNGG